MDEEKRSELLMDHYKDTFAIILDHWKTRNRLFMYVLALIAILGVDSLSPGSLSNFVNEYLKSKLQTGASWKTIDFAAVDLLARFLLLFLVIQYYQRSISVDRLYNYIHNLEEKICATMGGDFVTREGKSYLSRKGIPTEDKNSKRPLFLQAVGPLYTYVFPIGLASLVVAQIVSQQLIVHIISQPFFNQKTLVDFLRVLCGLGIAVYSILYVWWFLKDKR